MFTCECGRKYKVERAREEKEYCRAGDRIIVHADGRDGESVLAQVGPHEFCLVDLGTGNRWTDPVKVKAGFSRVPLPIVDILAGDHSWSLKEEGCYAD